MIRTIHRIWLGEELPAEFAHYRERWEELNPGWTVRDWQDSAELPPLICQDLFDRAPELVPNDWRRVQSDLLRIELLYSQGGVYADTDVEPLKPLEPLIDGVPAWAAWEAQDRWVCQFILGAAEPGHPFFKRLLDGLPEHFERHLGKPTPLLTGPRYVTQTYRRYPDELHVFDQRLFCPYDFSELDRAGEEFPDAVCAHHWNNRRSGKDSSGRAMRRCVS